MSVGTVDTMSHQDAAADSEIRMHKMTAFAEELDTAFLDNEVHVDAREFSVFYGQNEAVVKLSAGIRAGIVTAIIGPSGCGKSTFLRTINRMNDMISDTRVEGTILYDGHDIYSDYDVIELRKRIGMVFQKPNPFPMSVYDNVAYGPRIRGLRRKGELNEIVEKSLVLAALWDEVQDRLDEPAVELSGGQQQRLCLARTLALQPDVILLDEPTSGLDPISMAKVEASLQELLSQATEG